MFLRPRSWLPESLIEAYDTHRFEAASALGRLRQKPYRDTSPDYLQVGSYETSLPGFLNTDQFGTAGVDFHVDIRHPLPFADNRWAGIYAHHTVEHINYPDALSFFKEAHRCLKPGGRIRIIVPDLAKFIAVYNDKGPDQQARFEALVPEGHLETVFCKTPLGFVNWAYLSTPTNMHRSGWDFETMKAALNLAGFALVREVQVNISDDPKLSGLDKAHWAQHSLYVEAQKAPN